MVHHLPQVHSDHHPVLIAYILPNPRQQLEKRFLFLAAWLQHSTFDEFMKEAWAVHEDDLT